MAMATATVRRRHDSEYDGIVQGHRWRRDPAERSAEWCEGCGMRLDLRRDADGDVRGVMVTPGMPASRSGCHSKHTREGGHFLMNDVTGRMDRVTERDWEGHGRLMETCSNGDAGSNGEAAPGAMPGNRDRRRPAAQEERSSSFGVIAADGLAPSAGEQLTVEEWVRLGHARRMQLLAELI